MGFQIEDGSGSGKQVGVTTNSELKTHSVSVSEEHSANMDYGEAYSWTFSDDPDANDDCIFYIKNTNDKNLCLEGLDLYVSGACEVYFEVDNTGTTAAGTDVTAANLNTSSGKSAVVTAKHDGDLQSGATLATGIETARWKFTAATATSQFNFPQDLIITPQQTFTIWVDTAGVVLQATLYGYFFNPTRD